MPKRTSTAASPPGTAVKSKRPKSDVLAAQDMAEYLERFSRVKQGGTGNHRPCRELIKQMIDLVGSNGQPAEVTGKLHEVIVAYGVGRCFTATSCGLAKKGGPSAHVGADELQRRRAFMLTHLEPVIEHLRSAWPRLIGLQRTDTTRAAETVEALVGAIEQQFNRRLLSAASKLLNMLGVELPIYDSLARSALGLGGDVSYEAYLTAWLASYEPLRAAYLEALEAYHADVGPVDLTVGNDREVTKEWLCMRAHDVRLMRLGK